MFSSHRIVGKAMIVVFGIFFAVVIGCKAAKFADTAANNAQNRIDTAFAVLEK